MELSIKLLSAIITALFFALPLHAADIQKWVDENGKVHYGQRAPLGQAGSAVKNSSVSTVSTTISAKEANLPSSVALYSTSWCGYCKEARAFMQRNNIRYSEYDIEKSSSAKHQYEKMGGRGVPFLVQGSKTVQGFNPNRYRAFFNLKRE